VTNKYSKLALALVLAALAMKFAIFAQPSATSSAAPVSGAVTVLDGNQHVLGTLLGLIPQQPVTQQPNSFVIYLASGGVDWLMSRRMIIFSRQANSFYVASGTGENAAATASQQLAESIETGGPNGSSTCYNHPYTIIGWLLAPFDASQRLNWELTGDPLRLTGPVDFKQF
jgi:hypothetical protein